MNKQNIIKYIQSSFVGTDKWKYCKNFKILKTDEYRIFDIYDEIDYVIDIGSCLGEVSYACSKLFPNAKIFSVEPCISTFNYLKKNLSSTNIKIINAGIWENDDSFLKVLESNVNIGSNKTYLANNREYICISKTIQTLFTENSIDTNKRIFLKIDCEGAERFIVNDVDLCKSVYQLSIELHKGNKERNELFKHFVNSMLETHDIISGKFKENKNCTIVFRVKGSKRKIVKRHELINYMISSHNYKSYLEVGVGYGQCYRNIICENKLGIDLHPKYTNGIIIGESDSFFQYCNEIYDIIFIDGDHSHEQSLKDIINSFEKLSDGGCIICHDCFPKNEKNQFVGSRKYNGQVWMAFNNFINKVPCKHNVIDMDHGCGVIFKNGEKNTTYDDAFKKYEWEDFYKFKKTVGITIDEFIKTNKAQ